MKKFFFLIGTGMAASISATCANAAISLCQTELNCMAMCGDPYDGVMQYCCKTGSTQTTCTCPTGWSYNSLTQLCSRQSTTDSDSSGYYTQEYGTCITTNCTTSDCYKMTTSGGLGDCSACPEFVIN